MKILFGVQRYGPGVAGGAEAACRQLAEHMARRSHHVEAVTSCAVDYVSWEDDFPAGVSELNGVIIHRLPVRAVRSVRQFGPLSSRVFADRPAALAVERDWVRVQGPDLPELAPWMASHAPRFDVAAFYTYLYPTSAMGLPLAAQHTATVLHPAAHDEPPMELRVFDDLMAHVDAVSVHTAEERETLERRFHRLPPLSEIGLGVDLDRRPGNGGRFRAEYHLGAAPILLYVGRIEPAKATDELARQFVEYKRRHPGDLKLVLMGAPVALPPEHPDIVCTGFVDEQVRADAYDASTVFVMPSYFESFSIALCDAWVADRPALVQGRCAVLRGQVARAQGGLPYDGYAEFDAALTRLLSDAGLRSRLASSGRRHVRANFGWGAVLDRYDELLVTAIRARADRRARLHGGLSRRD